MRLHELSPKQGSRTRIKRYGCGESSGHGKTSGRGGKGQTARSGGSLRPGFEGGQMPLIRRIPKRGFNNSDFKKVYCPVNLKDLNRFEDGQIVDENLLRKVGLVKGQFDGVKILGTGELKKRLTICAHAFSQKAKEIIENAGGKCEIVKQSPGPQDEKQEKTQ